MIRAEIDERGVATLWLARAEKHNALSSAMLVDLKAGIERLGADPAVRVVVLAGEGKSFCAGGDLKWMQAQMSATGETRAAEAWKLADALAALNSCPKPVIGRIHGNTFGGGVGLACVCDVAVGVAGIKLGLTETKLGLIPATIGPYVVARMGEGRARQVFMSSRVFDATEAERLGILSRVVDMDDLDAAIEAEVIPYLSCAPGAVAEAKAMALELGGAPDRTVVAKTIEALVTRWESDEAGEGISAFFDKRKAGWVTG